MRAKISFFFSLFMFCSLLHASSPVVMLEDVANQVISELKKNRAVLKTQPHVSYDIVKKYLIPKVDIYGMSRSVLGRSAWQRATREQRRDFAKGFVRLIIRTYASALNDYSGEVVEFYPIRGGYADKRFLNVNSVVKRGSGKQIPLTYSLVNKKGQWRVYDMTVEGVSLLQSFKSQFRAELSRGDINDLIQKLKK